MLIVLIEQEALFLVVTYRQEEEYGESYRVSEDFKGSFRTWRGLRGVSRSFSSFLETSEGFGKLQNSQVRFTGFSNEFQSHFNAFHCVSRDFNDVTESFGGNYGSF